MRWILLLLTVAACALAFSRDSAGAMAWWSLLALVGTVASVLAFAQARIARSARDDSLSEYELMRLRDACQASRHDRSTPER